MKRNITDVRTAVAAHRTKILNLQQNLAQKKHALHQRLGARKIQLSSARTKKQMESNTNEDHNSYNSGNGTTARGAVDSMITRTNTEHVIARGRWDELGQGSATHAILEELKNLLQSLSNPR